LLCTLAHLLIRMARVQFLIAPIAKVPLGRIMAINGIATALVTFLPLRLGEVARPAMLRERGKLSGMAVTGTVAAERILDGVVYSALLLAGLAIAEPRLPLPERVGDLPVSAAIVPFVARVAALGFAAAFVLMVFFYVWRSFARRVVERVLGIFSSRIARKLADMLERLSDGLRFLANWRHALAYMLATLLAVAVYVWGIEMLAQAVGLPELTLAQTSVVVGVLALGFAAPNAPGFFGAIQLALYAGLALYVAGPKVVHEGAALVFLFYVSYLGVVILLALLSLVAEYRMTSTGASQSSV
jgi:hypothetical protein